MDCASIVNSNLYTVWDYLSANYEICFPGMIKDFRHLLVDSDRRHEWLDEYKNIEIKVNTDGWMNE